MKEKQIDEISKLICTYPQCVNYNKIGGCKIAECQTVDIAENLYKQGYRKVVNCKDCRHLEIINDGKIYAKCRQTDFEFLPFGTDTRTHFCAFGEMKGAE